MLAQHATFRSTAFEHTTPQPHFINPCCFGEDVIAWLRGRISAPGVRVSSDVIQEDYGWGIWLDIGGAPYWVCVSVDEDSIGTEIGVWRLTVAYETGINPFRRLRNPPRRDQLMLACRAVDAVLHSGETVGDVTWWSEPEELNGAPHPQ